MNNRDRKAMEEYGLLYPSDLVPVVRCKDCKYRWHYIDNMGNEVYKCEVEMDLCDPYEIGRKPYLDDWFCADGERRTDNETN